MGAVDRPLVVRQTWPMSAALERRADHTSGPLTPPVGEDLNTDAGKRVAGRPATLWSGTAPGSALRSTPDARQDRRGLERSPHDGGFPE